MVLILGTCLGMKAFDRSLLNYFQDLILHVIRSLLLNTFGFCDHQIEAPSSSLVPIGLVIADANGATFSIYLPFVRFADLLAQKLLDIYNALDKSASTKSIKLRNLHGTSRFSCNRMAIHLQSFPMFMSFVSTWIVIHTCGFW